MRVRQQRTDEAEEQFSEDHIIIQLGHDERLVDFRLVSIADADARGIDAVRPDRAVFDLRPRPPLAAEMDSMCRSSRR